MGEHIPGLDGLRGIAVLGVLMFHANGRLRGGYLGVDLFFVLSGFLITSILVEEHAKRGRIDLRMFWIRRARRLLPALLSLMPAVALYAKTLATPSELAPLRGDALATLAYVANWRAIFTHRSYWEMFVAPSPLEHTWSLAIEEQFYVVWPLLVVVVFSVRRSARAVGLVSVVLAAASCAAMLLLYDGDDSTRVYLGTDTRGASILAGAALATLGPRSAPRGLDVLGVVALGGLGVAWWSLDGQNPFLYRGGFWLTEIAALVLVACCVLRQSGPIARIFSWHPLRAMGTISYGVYLWHWPVYMVLTEERLRVGALTLLALRLGVTLVIAVVSYRFLERPIRQRGIPWGKPLLIVPAAFAVAVIVVLASTRGASSAATPKLTFVPTPPPEPPPSPSGPTKPIVAMNLLPPPSALPPGTLRVLVEGDSVALALGARMRYAQDSADAFVAQRAVGDCSILDGVVPVHSMGGEPHGNGNCASAWVDDAKELDPDVVAIVLGGAYFSKVKGDGRWRTVCDPLWHDPYAHHLADVLKQLVPYTRRRVVVYAAYPVGHWQTPTLDDKVDCYNRILRDAATESGAEILDLNAWICPDRKCIVTSRDAPVRPDGLHFDGLGAEDTAQWVLGQIRAGGPRDF